jgi:hypothetical protein
MLYGIIAVFDQLPQSIDAVLDALGVDRVQPLAQTPATPSSMR